MAWTSKYTAFQVRALVCNCILQKTMDNITYSYHIPRWTMLVKGTLDPYFSCHCYKMGNSRDSSETNRHQYFYEQNRVLSMTALPYEINSVVVFNHTAETALATIPWALQIIAIRLRPQQILTWFQYGTEYKLYSDAFLSMVQWQLPHLVMVDFV